MLEQPISLPHLLLPRGRSRALDAIQRPRASSADPSSAASLKEPAPSSSSQSSFKLSSLSSSSAGSSKAWFIGMGAGGAAFVSVLSWV